MQMSVRSLADASAMALTTWISQEDYNVTSEAEFCALFFHQLLLQSQDFGVLPAQLHREVKLYRYVERQKRVSASIDFGIATIPNERDKYELCIEAKTWIRSPTNTGAFSQNSSTSKRKQCVRDALRLRLLRSSGLCRECCILIFEQGSTHLRRRLRDELLEDEVAFSDVWLDTERPSLGRRKEHIGLIWLDG